MEAYQWASLIISALSLLGVGTLTKYLITDAREKRKMRSVECKQQEKLQKQQEMREVMQEELQPIVAKMEEMHATDPIKNEALQAILRDRLYQLNIQCVQQGYTTQDQRDNFENMYDKYHRLGANGVMDKTHDRFFALPTEEEFDIQQK